MATFAPGAIERIMSHPTTPDRSRLLRRILWSAAGIIVGGVVAIVLHMMRPHYVQASGKLLLLPLTGGNLEMPFFCNRPNPRGIVILGTGDGGWSYWEENTAKHLASKGYAVGGWDCRKFADSRTYDYGQLCAGFLAAFKEVAKRCRGADKLPVWYAGWSTGAEQSLAAATAANRPHQLAGLLLVAPGSRGRYGLTASDLLGQTPTGPDTFSLAEMSQGLRGLPIVELAAELDPLVDTEWLSTYPGPKKIFHLSGVFHDMGGAGELFLSKLDESIAWTLKQRH